MSEPDTLVVLAASHATNMADQIAANFKAANRYVSKQVKSDADELARQLHEAAASTS
jgi:uncharacterized NAD(P)/FAD-binding protein YdhS